MVFKHVFGSLITIIKIHARTDVNFEVLAKQTLKIITVRDLLFDDYATSVAHFA